MIGDKEDLRVIRTRKLLATALFDLLETMPYEKISVMDICNKALVHRATFYNHFQSKEDLLEYSIDEIKEELFNTSIENEKFNTPRDMYISLISKVIDFVETNKNKLLVILNHNSYEKAMNLLLITIKRSIRYLISKNEYKEEYTIPKNILIDFISGGFANIGLNWLQSPNPCPKEELIGYFKILLNENLYIKK